MLVTVVPLLWLVPAPTGLFDCPVTAIWVNTKDVVSSSLSASLSLFWITPFAGFETVIVASSSTSAVSSTAVGSSFTPVTVMVIVAVVVTVPSDNV